MNSKIDPEFLSKETEDGLDFVAFMTYLAEVEAQIPRMVDEITEGGAFHKDVFERHFFPIRCNLGRKYLIYRVSMRLLKLLAGVDLEPYYLRADADYPAGKGVTVIASAVKHHATARELQHALEIMQKALDEARGTVHHLQEEAPAARHRTNKAENEEDDAGMRRLSEEEVREKIEKKLEHDAEVAFEGDAHELRVTIDRLTEPVVNKKTKKVVHRPPMKDKEKCGEMLLGLAKYPKFSEMWTFGLKPYVDAGDFDPSAIKPKALAEILMPYTRFKKTIPLGTLYVYIWKEYEKLN